MSIVVLIVPEFALPPAIESEWLAALPPDRRAELRGWPHGQARQRSLLGSQLLLKGLKLLERSRPASDSLTLGSSPLDSLQYRPDARPTLALPVEFSLSHCTGLVLCAVSTCGPVGVDVEALGPLTAEEFRLYLSDKERVWAGGSKRRFYSVWTRKEAVVKAAGTSGLRELPRVETMPENQSATFAGQTWQTLEIPVGPDYVAHLALQGQPAEVSVVWLSKDSFDHDALPMKQCAHGLNA